MPCEKAHAPVPTKPDVEIWDTQYLPQNLAFDSFRDGICNAFMPWTFESRPESEFSARMESIIIGTGSIGRVRMSPITAVRNKSNISMSSTECVYGNFVLAGELHIEQRGRSNVARQGDVILYDSSSPTTLREQHDGAHDGAYEDVPFMIPKSYYPATSDAGQLFGNIVLPRQSVMRPLSSCLTFIANNMMSLSREELTALFEACAALLPVAVGHTNDARNEKIDIPKANYILREILSFVHRHISDISLSPQTAADAFDISIRYVHKLFAANGTTFNSYVNSKRLDLVSIDLLSPTCRNQPISTLAYRWGFNDLSTFNRLFKARFGSTPSQFRSGGVI